MSCALALTILLPAAVQADSGYEFSLSASDSDPFENIATPTDTMRNIYLWATCIEDGLAAFEGDLTSTLTVLGFNPLNGVLNIGGATNLLLAVPGCPYGANVNFLLGYWVVQDVGGSLCLEPSAANGLLGGVDCAADPVLTEAPIVIGFSSNGSPPCSTGVAACPVGGGGSFGSFGT